MASCCAVETGLSASDVLSAFPKPTWALVTPCGLDVFDLCVSIEVVSEPWALEMARACGMETGLSSSAVLSTRPSPIWPGVTLSDTPTDGHQRFLVCSPDGA